MIVDELYKIYGEELGLELIAGKKGLARTILAPEVERPGLSLIGYTKGYSQKRILVFDKVEIEFLSTFSSQERSNILKKVLNAKTPFIILTPHSAPLREIVQLCEEKNIPLMRSNVTTTHLMYRLIILLVDAFSPVLSCHGSFVEIFGIGVLIQGDAAIGK